MGDSDAARAIYAQLWSEAQARFKTGSVRTDPHLDQRASDTRRGMTLLVRPNGEAKARISAALDDLHQIAPDQHLYHPDELHITVLSVVSAAAGADLDTIPVDAYHAVFAEVFAQIAPFTVRMTGISAAPDTVFVYGESDGDALNLMREQVRAGLRRAGLAQNLERRYRSVTAHMSALRFRSTPTRLPALVDYLHNHHQCDLGHFTATHCDFVSNDWYMSRDIVQLQHRYALARQSSPDNIPTTED